MTGASVFQQAAECAGLLTASALVLYLLVELYYHLFRKPPDDTGFGKKDFGG